MKYNVGDLVFIKDCKYKPLLRPHLDLHLDLHLHVHLYLYPRLRLRLCHYREMLNSYGIVTEAIKHSDAWEVESTNGDNVYVWFSQVDGKEYYFFENEITGEVVK